MAPQGNNLLRVAFTITSSPATIPPGKMKDHYIYWGDNTGVTYVTNGTYYHTYAATGSYTPSLIYAIYDSTTWNLYCSDTETHAITVNYLPCASTISTVVSPSNTVTATATAMGGSGSTYIWSWGDGSPNTSGNPATHVYSTSGYKTITLTTVNGTCTLVNNTIVGVSTGSSNCSSAIANFTSSVSGSTASFSPTSSNVPFTYQLQYWSYGDGSTSSNWGGSHTYTTGGSYNVCLVTSWHDSVTNNVNCMDSVCKTITVGSNPSNIISGTIFLDTTVANFASTIKVWLIKFDSATNILSAVDSQTIVNSFPNWATYYSFTNKAPGQYRTKAHILNGPTSGTAYVPTYHDSALIWSSANIIYHSGGSSLYKNILMRIGTAVTGPGFIGGNVSAGANKGTTAGIAGESILLFDANNNLVQGTFTDANGDYTFSGLPVGTYKVYPEETGFTTTPMTLTIQSSKPVILGAYFSRSESKMTIKPGNLGVANINAASTFTVYPNPAKDNITINWDNTNGSKDAELTVTDITGKKVYHTICNTGAAKTINLSNFQKGLYFINIIVDGASETKKFILQ